MCVGMHAKAQVSPDFHASEETGDHTMLALAAEGIPSLEAGDEQGDESTEALNDDSAAQNKFFNLFSLALRQTRFERLDGDFTSAFLGCDAVSTRGKAFG